MSAALSASQTTDSSSCGKLTQVLVPSGVLAINPPTRPARRTRFVAATSMPLVVIEKAMIVHGEICGLWDRLPDAMLETEQGR